MDLNTRCLYLVIIAVGLNLLVDKNGLILAENPESQRLKLYNKAMDIRYGYEGHKGNAYKSISLFEKAAQGQTDEIATESLYELGMIHLLGYKRFFKFNYDVGKATHYLSKSAELGNPTAQFVMAFMHTQEIKNGPVVDKHKAMDYLKSSASENYLPAMIALAYHYLYKEVSPDVKKAIKLYKRAIWDNITHLKPDLLPQDDLNVNEYNNELLEQYFEPTQMEVEEENSISEQPSGCKGGNCNTKKEPEKTETSKEDRKKLLQEVLEHWKSAGSPELLANKLIEFALNYMYGRGVLSNHETAVGLLEDALSLGSIDAARLLGMFYFFGTQNPEEGKPIPINYEKSLKYFKISAVAQDSESIYFIAEILHRMALSKSPTQIFLEIPYIYSLHRIAADYGFVPSYVRCGQMLENGFGVELDLMQAALNYKTAAEQFYVDVLPQSLIYHNAGNYHATTVLCSLAAFTGLSTGQYNVALLMDSGKAKLFNKNMFKTHLNDALLQGETDVLFHMARAAEKEGKMGVAQDLYQRGFNAGDMRCLDPLISYLSKTNLKKAMNLLEFKRYRSRIDLNSGDTSVVSNFYSNMLTYRKLGLLKMKQLIYNVFS